MILMDELKPILEPLLNEENSADIIQKITSIDKSEEDLTQSIRSKIDAEWNEKFKKAFFNNEGIPATKVEEKPEASDSNIPNTIDDKEPDVPHKFEDLFKEGD